jgi:hypothetical protein
MSAGEDDFTRHIKEFIERENYIQPSPPEEPTPVIPPRSFPNPMPIFFEYNGETLQMLDNNATPSALAAHFGLDRHEIQLNRGDKVLIVHQTEDRFKPNVKVGNTYRLTKKVHPPVPVPRTHSHLQMRQNGTCTLIANDQKKDIPAGTVKRATIIAHFGINSRLEHVRLIGHDGTVINNRNQYELNPGSTYHVIYSDQDPLEIDNEEDNEDSEEIFNKPMASIAPFMIALIRILYTLSFTGDSIIFTTTNTEQKPKSEAATSRLLCPHKLSTCAYQITYRFNAALKVIKKLSDTVLQISPRREQMPEIFDHPEAFLIIFNSLRNLVYLLEKAHDELEEFLKIIVKEMRTINPSIESVKISLKVETNQENRIINKVIKQQHNELNLFEKCEKLAANDEEIFPTDANLNAISCNRRYLNHATEIMENALRKLDDKSVLEEVTNLLDFCAKISHCNLMHWIFARDLFQKVNEEYNSDTKDTADLHSKNFVISQIYSAIETWNNVSRGVPLSVTFNEEIQDIQTIWNKMKESITTSQYALEINRDNNFN